MIENSILNYVAISPSDVAELFLDRYELLRVDKFFPFLPNLALIVYKGNTAVYGSKIYFVNRQFNLS